MHGKMQAPRHHPPAKRNVLPPARFAAASAASATASSAAAVAASSGPSAMPILTPTPPRDLERSAHIRDDPLRQPPGAAPGGEAGDEHAELVAAETHQGVRPMHLRTQPVGDLAEQRVAGALAPGGGDLPEMVEIEHQQRAAAAGDTVQQRLLQPVVEIEPVRQAGQCVVAGEVAGSGGEPLPLRLGRATLGDIGEERHDQIARRHEPERDPEIRPLQPTFAHPGVAAAPHGRTGGGEPGGLGRRQCL
jgi:hypothetical protein